MTSPTYTASGDVGLLRFDDGRVNALGPDALAAADAALDVAERDATGALVVAGRPAIFCAGLDLKLLPTLPPDAMGEVTSRFVALVSRLFLFPKPVVAAAAGPALAGGFMLYCASDHRVAGATARFALTEVAAGVPVIGPTAAVVSAALAPTDQTAVLLHGLVLDAEAALVRGLVQERADDVDAAAHRAAQARIPRDRAAYHVTKLALRRPLLEAAAATAAALAPLLPQGNVFRTPRA